MVRIIIKGGIVLFSLQGEVKLKLSFVDYNNRKIGLSLSNHARGYSNIAIDVQ